jgi:CRP-like cAMP-binding protein
MVPDYGRETGCRDIVGSAILRALHYAGLRMARASHEVHLTRMAQSTEEPRGKTLLRHTDLFRLLNDAEHADLASHMEERFFPKGSVVVRRGDGGNSLYLLVEGALEVGVGGEDAAPITTDVLVPGDVFGEMSLLTGQPRSATVIAVTDVLVHEIHKEALDPILQHRPEIAGGLATIMADRQASNSRLNRGSDRSSDSPLPAREDLLGRLRAFFQLS